MGTVSNYVFFRNIAKAAAYLAAAPSLNAGIIIDNNSNVLHFQNDYIPDRAYIDAVSDMYHAYSRSILYLLEACGELIEIEGIDYSELNAWRAAREQDAFAPLAHRIANSMQSMRERNGGGSLGDYEYRLIMKIAKKEIL